MVQVPATFIKLSFCFSCHGHYHGKIYSRWNKWNLLVFIVIEITLTFHIMKPNDEIAWSMFITSFPIDNHWFITIITVHPAPVFIGSKFAGIIDIWCDVDHDLIWWKTWLDTGCAYFTVRIRFNSRLVLLNLKNPEPSDENNLPSRWLCYLRQNHFHRKLVLDWKYLPNCCSKIKNLILSRFEKYYKFSSRFC